MEAKEAPYPGLRPYREDERGKFFGREADKAILVDKILGNRLTLLFAASGVGKSSLLQAAVIPYLRADGGENLSVVCNTDWVSEPLGRLREVILETLRADGTLPADAAPEAGTLAELLEFCGLFARPPLVLILDQFEEFFRYQRHDAGFRPFIEQLTAVITDAALPVSVVISMREDFAMELNALKPYLPILLFDNFFRLEKLSIEAARDAITLPIKQKNYMYETGLLDKLLDDLSNQDFFGNSIVNNILLIDSVELPYLQIICSYLWSTKRGCNDNKMIFLEDYVKFGGAKGILHGHLSRILNGFSGEEKYVADRVFSCLVSYPGFKVAYTVEGLSKTTNVIRGDLSIILNKLEKTHIVCKNKSKNDVWYELYHDMYSQIIREWQYSWRDTFDYHYGYSVLKRKGIIKMRFNRGSFESIKFYLARIVNSWSKIFKIGSLKSKKLECSKDILLKSKNDISIIGGSNYPIQEFELFLFLKKHIFRLFDEEYGAVYLLFVIIILMYLIIAWVAIHEGILW